MLKMRIDFHGNADKMVATKWNRIVCQSWYKSMSGEELERLEYFEFIGVF